MTTERNYPRAPITEAIIDLRAELPDRLTLAELERCQDGEEAAYPTKMSLNPAVGRLQAGTSEEPPSHKAMTEQIGFLFKSADEKQLFQVHRDGFAIHRLAPYLGWEPFRDEARRLWKVYQERVRPRRVVRTALRYISRLDLPGLGVELKDYLRTFPEVSPDLPQELAGFFMELNLPQRDIQSTLLLREIVVPPAAPGVTSVVLDVDLFRSEDIPSDDARIWALLEVLHARKNEIIEACITNRTREAIQ
jgi:uncharacterized protein (TIGR04255 family)